MTNAPADRPLRVALLCHYPDDEIAPAGGPWTVGRNLAAGLAEAGVEVHVVRYRGGSGQNPPRVQNGLVTVHSLDLSRQSPAIAPRQVACMPAVARALQEIRPDAVSAHAPEYALPALREGLPTAVTIHGVVRRELRVFPGWRERLPLLVSIWQDWQMARQARHIVAINDYVIAQYRRRTAATFHRINLPISDVFFQAPEREPEPCTLLLVGGMNERKDPMTLLHALLHLRQRLPDAQLRIAGRVGEQGFGARLRRFIADNDLAGHVRLLGALNQPQLAQEYAACSLLVLSSRQETSPTVILEAMAARRPVVATDVGGVRELVVEGQSGFVTPAGDSPALAAAIEQVLRDPDRARAMGRQGRALAEAGYRCALIGRQYAELLAHLAQGAAG